MLASGGCLIGLCSAPVSDSGDLWQRYDAKVVQLRVAEQTIAGLEAALAELREDRDRLAQKLLSARTLAERLRNSERVKGRRLGGDATQVTRVREEYERAREVIGLMLSALAGAWNGREQAWKAQTSDGGRLLFALTRGAMASVSIESHRVDHDWLRALDLERLRAQLGFGEVAEEVEEQEIDMSSSDAYEDETQALPPPPSFQAGAVPPLLSTLDPYDDDPEPPPKATPPRSVPSGQTTAVRQMPAPPFRIGKLVKP